HDSADLCLEHADPAVDDFQLLRAERYDDLWLVYDRRVRAKDLRHVQRWNQPGVLDAVLRHGRGVHILLCPGDFPAAKYRREPAAAKRLYPWYSTRSTNALVPFGRAYSHHRRRR